MTEKRAMAQRLRAEGMTYQEIARVTGRNISTIYRDCNDNSRARAARCEALRRGRVAGICDTCGGRTRYNGRTGRAATRCDSCSRKANGHARKGSKVERERLPVEVYVERLAGLSHGGVAPSTRSRAAHAVYYALAARGVSWAEACERAGVLPRRPRQRK